MKSTLAPLLAVLLPLGLHAQSAPPSCLDGITLQTHDFNTGQPHSFTSDGNTATIAEMLLQSHEGRIALLPSLPTNWPAGSVSGLRARGGFTVDMAWTNGWLTAATIHSVSGTNCIVQYGSQTIQTNLPLGGSDALNWPPVPTGLVATAAATNQINLVWNSFTTATNYNDTGLAGATTYYYVVSAVVSGSEPPDSAQASATTRSPFVYSWGSHDFLAQRERVG